MLRILKWVAYGLAGLASVLVVAVGVAFAASEWTIRRPVPKPAVRLAAAADPGAVARGLRVATVAGCAQCHGANYQGRMFDDIPGVVKAYAPNLTRVVARDSDADLDRAIRHGVGSDGRALWIMPSATFAHLTDAETADLLAYLRTFPPAGPEQPRLGVGPLGRIAVVTGQFKSEAAVMAAHENPPLPDLGPQYAQGRSVARACVECHGPALRGGGPLHTPDLTIAAAYDLPDFARLMRTGVAAGDRHVGMMSDTAKVRFAVFSDAEVAALHGYLKARADLEVKGAATKPLPKS
ncbi:MAG: c-type cytochrome [Caulobacterales bacterium]|nr:c-type cytochrome [Caulobacterales bacterium]